MLFQQRPIDLGGELEKQLKNNYPRRQDPLKLFRGNPTVQIILSSPVIGGDATKIGYPLRISSDFDQCVWLLLGCIAGCQPRWHPRLAPVFCEILRRVLPDPDVLQMTLQSSNEKSLKYVHNHIHRSSSTKYLLDFVMIAHIEIMK